MFNSSCRSTVGSSTPLTYGVCVRRDYDTYRDPRTSVREVRLNPKDPKNEFIH